MRVAFVNLPADVPELMYTKKVRKQYVAQGQVLPNLSSLYLAAWLEKHGHKVKYVEAFALRYDLRDITREIKNFDAEVICISLITEIFQNSLNWIKRIKQECNIPIVVGGVHMDVYYKETLGYDCIDFGIRGKAWNAIAELMKELEKKNPRFDKIHNLVYKKNNKIMVNPLGKDTTTLNDVPQPARHLTPIKSYSTLLSKKWPTTVALTSSGCPFNCAYCDVKHISLEFRDAKNMIEEIKQCDRLGIKEIHYQDETFTLNKQRVIAFCEELKKLNTGISWSIRTRADLVDESLIKLMKEAGCYKIHFGIESANSEVLKNLGRNIPLKKIAEAVNLCRKYKILTLGFVMIGNPGEGKKEALETLEFIKKLPLDFIQVNKLTPCPLSDLYNRLVKEKGIDYWGEYTKGNWGKIKEMGNYFSELSDSELEDMQKKIFREFYFRPSYMLNRILQLRSLKEFKMMFEAALSLM